MRAARFNLGQHLGNRPIGNAEEQFQISLIEHLKWYGNTDVLWWHCPNGGKRTKAAAGKLKAMGVRPGVPDLQFMFPDGRVAFLELKAQGGIVSDEQTVFLKYCERAGIEAAIAYNIDQAVSILQAWRVLPQ